MVQTIKIPWASWYKPNELTLEFPDSWDIHVFNVKEIPEISDNKEIERILDNPIGTPTLAEIAKGKKNAVIVAEDISRSSRVENILTVVLNQLNDVGINDENITLISALGGHRPMIREDFIKKIGISVLERINVENHHPFLNLIYLGKSKLGTPIYINKSYYKADIRITIGSVIPHNLAGFGGGAKIVLPGICGLKTIEANHRMSIRENNIDIGHITELRKDIEDVCSRVGLNFSINIVPTINGGIGGLFAGHYIKAHRAAIKLLKNIYEFEIPLNQNFDIGFFNAYPQDTDLSQSIKALNIYFQNPKIVAPRGVVVMLTASTEGRGYQSLDGESGAPLYTNFENLYFWKKFGKRTVCLFSPNITNADVHHYYPRSIIFEKDFKKLIKKLENIVGNAPSICIFPCSIQMLRK